MGPVAPDSHPGAVSQVPEWTEVDTFINCKNPHLGSLLQGVRAKWEFLERPYPVNKLKSLPHTWWNHRDRCYHPRPEELKSGYSYLILTQKKPDGLWRLSGDNHKLNQVVLPITAVVPEVVFLP